MPVQEILKFADDSKIVNAVPHTQGKFTRLVVMSLMGGLFACMLIFIWVEKQSDAGLLRHITMLGLAVAIIMIAIGLKDTLIKIFRYGQLKRRGQKAVAILVGRGCDMDADPELYWVYYQFRPDFVARHEDETRDQDFYKMPTGHQIEVLYLPESPQVTTVAELGRL